MTVKGHEERERERGGYRCESLLGYLPAGHVTYLAAACVVVCCPPAVPCVRGVACG